MDWGDHLVMRLDGRLLSGRARDGRQFLLFVVALLGSTSTIAARSDEIDQCMAKKQTEFEAPQQFTQGGEITCPAGDVVGFPPRIRRNERSGAVAYTAPQGYVIQNRAIDSITVQNVSQNNGRYGAPSISADGRIVTVPIACDGKGPGEGRSWQQINIAGVINRSPTQDDIKSWAIQCVRCVAQKDCP
jgi:hypothetical protein